MTTTKTQKEEAKNTLLEMLKPGECVYTILDRVSPSGMMREIRLVLLKIDDKGEVYTLHPNHSASILLGVPRSKKGDGLRVKGCGMDMGFHLVYELSYALFGDGYALKHRWM